MRLSDVHTEALRRAVDSLGRRSDTYHVSCHPVVEHAHAAHLGDRNYHAMIGKALRAHAQALGIRYAGQTGRRRSAAWVRDDPRPAATDTARPVEEADLDLLEPEVRPLVAAVLARGAPAPVIGYELDGEGAAHGWQVEAAWPAQRVAILTDALPRRDRWLRDQGWHVKPAEAWSPPALVKALHASGDLPRAPAPSPPEPSADPPFLTREALEQEHCWFESDRVPGRPDVTAFKRRARLHQARWRQERGLPIGGRHHKGTWIPMGSRVALDHAVTSGATFLSDPIRSAAKHRIANPEPHQMLDEKRLWSDLLSSMPMCFNLFGELWDRPEPLNVAKNAWFADAPGQVAALRFEWSPGRLDPAYLGNRSAFDTAFLLDLDDGRRGVIGIETKYHEHARPEAPPSEVRLRRYQEVTEESGVFQDGWRQAIVGTELQQLWLDHLLALSMLQHPSGEWRWVQFVLVHPAGNPSFAEAAARYRDLLSDPTTFASRTIESLLDDDAALPERVVAEFRRRYVLTDLP